MAFWMIFLFLPLPPLEFIVKINVILLKRKSVHITEKLLLAPFSLRMRTKVLTRTWWGVLVLLSPWPHHLITSCSPSHSGPIILIFLFLKHSKYDSTLRPSALAASFAWDAFPYDTHIPNSRLPTGFCSNVIFLEKPSLKKTLTTPTLILLLWNLFKCTALKCSYQGLNSQFIAKRRGS